jgi:hypothetical protein
MKRLLTLTPMLVFLVCSGCGDSHDSLTSESLSTMSKLVATLDGVKDEASAKSAKSDVKSLLTRLNEINTRQSKLPAPTEAEGKAIEKKYAKQMEELSTKLQGNMLRIVTDPKIASVFEDIDLKSM